MNISGVGMSQRELRGLVKEVDRREVIAGNAAPKRRKSFGGVCSALLELARRTPAARPIIGVDLTQPFRQGDDWPNDAKAGTNARLSLFDMFARHILAVAR